MGRLDEVEGSWRREAEAVLSGVREWRAQHPTATLAEIEAALDERLSGMRARLLEDLALASEAARVAGAGPGGRPARAAAGRWRGAGGGRGRR